MRASTGTATPWARSTARSRCSTQRHALPWPSSVPSRRNGTSSGSGLFMDVAGASTENNAPIVQYFKHGGITNQLFQQVFADAASF